jgi:hypothetical protein
MPNGSYYPGEGIHLKIRFEHSARVKQIRATFVHEKDGDVRTVLSGVPNKQEDGEWLAILSGRAGTKLGAYRCVALTSEYDGGYEVSFRTRIRDEPPLRDAIFSVTDPPVRPPVLVDDWEWASN